MQPTTLLLPLLLGLTTSCQLRTTHSPQSEAITPPAPISQTAARNEQRTFNIAITGMHCEGCASGIRSELARLPGVFSAKVTLGSARARVIAQADQVSAAQLIHAIEEAGYQAKIIAP